MQVLPKRLEMIISMVPPSTAIADIGCDHAYTAISLVKRNIAESAIACDINAGPLRSAEKNIREEQLSSRIETRLGDGLSPVRAGEVDTIIISGMGGMLMQQILNGRLQDFRHFILSPQKDLPAFRHFLMTENACILNECMVEEDGKYYTVVHACPKYACTEEQLQKSLYLYKDELAFTYGGWNLVKKDPVLFSFLQKEKERYRNILRNTDAREIVNAYQLVESALEAYL